MKQQLRQLKLFELGIADWPYQTPYEEMKRVVDDNLNGYEIKTSDKYPNRYFYTKNGKIIMEQDQKNDRLWIRWDGFWSVFSNQFSLELTDIQAIIKFLVQQHLKCKVVTPLTNLESVALGTPYNFPIRVPLLAEQHLITITNTGVVEQHLKCNVGTPELCHFPK